MPAAYFTGGSLGQGKEACCDAQEKLETRRGKRQACAQDGGKAHDAERGKVQGPACGQWWCSETRGQEVVVPVEDTIIDVLEEPVPGVVVVTEYESIGRLLPFRPAVSPSAAPVPRPKNNKSVAGQFEKCSPVILIWQRLVHLSRVYSAGTATTTEPVGSTSCDHFLWGPLSPRLGWATHRRPWASTGRRLALQRMHATVSGVYRSCVTPSILPATTKE